MILLLDQLGINENSGILPIDPNKKDSRDNSNALHIACCYNNSTHDILEVVKLLIER